MDWASTEWKQALAPLAVQKVNALEEKIEKLQKERQQKQLQYECLELALEKEKRKTEKEKQQTTEVQRELQSLANICKDFESKQQKLQNELQSRDSRIKNLEVLLSQSKKENCKLQQLVSDLKDVNCLRENTLMEREQRIQKSNEENITNQSIDNFEIENSLKQKIAEQDALIMELRANLTLISKKDELNETSNEPFKTPKSKSVSVTDSPAVNSKNTSNIWDGFSSTPAKGNKDRILGHCESSSMDYGDEKLTSLQSRLKQLCQELDCQRHNFEASKNALEMKYKESESTLKADLKYQVQANAELDKQLKDSKNKYQQELSQAAKKLDILTLQLKKTEEANVLIERDLKSMESKLSTNESILRIKEEQLQDLQKSKNACDATLQLLQFQISAVEQKYRVLVEEKNSLSENVKAYEVQLEGSNNLVKEKEISLLEAQRKLQNVQVRLQELENQFTVQEEKLQKSQRNETSLLEEIEFLKQEIEELNISLNSEIIKCKSMELSIKEQTQGMALLKEELEEKTLNIDILKNQIMNSSNEFEMNVNELKEKLFSANEELGILRNKLQESSAVEISLKEQVEHLQISNRELSDASSKETHISDCLKRNLDEEAQKMSALREEYSSKCLELKEVKSQIQISKKEFQENIHKMEEKFNDRKQELDAFQNQLQETSSMKVYLNEKVEQLEKANIELSDYLSAESNKSDCLKISLDEEAQKMLLLKEELSSKCLEIEDLNSQILNSKNQYENKIQESNFTMKFSKDIKTSTETELKTFKCDKRSFKEKIELLEQEKVELSNQLKLEVLKVQQLKLLFDEEKQLCSELEDKLENKSLKFEDLNCLMKVLIADLVQSMLELDEKLHAAKQELDALQNQLQESSSLKKSLTEKVEQLELSNKELSQNLTAETNKSDCLKWNLDKEAQIISSLGEELSFKCSELEEVNNQILVSKNQFETKLQELNAALSTSEEKVLFLESQLKDNYSSGSIVKEKLAIAEQEKLELSNRLNLLTVEFQQLQLAMEDEKKASSSLKEMLASSCAELNEFSNQIKKLNDSHELKVKELESKFCTVEAKTVMLENQLKESLPAKISAKQEIEVTERHKSELLNEVTSKSIKIQELELSIEEEKLACSLLKEKLENYSEEFQKLSDQMKDLNNLHEEKVHEFEEKFSSVEHKSLMLEAQLQEFSANKVPSKQIEVLEQEKLELVNQLKLEVIKVEQLESSIGEEKQECSQLKVKLEQKCLELDALNSQINSLKNEHETKIQELNAALSSSEMEALSLKSRLNDISSNESIINGKLKLVEQQKSELSHHLMLEAIKVQQLESSIQEFKELSNRMKLKNENDIQIPNAAPSSSKAKIIDLEAQLKVYSLNDNASKESLELVEQEKIELANQVKLETLKIQQLDSNIEEETPKCVKEILEQNCMDLQVLKSEMNGFMDEIEIDTSLHTEDSNILQTEHKTSNRMWCEFTNASEKIIDQLSNINSKEMTVFEELNFLTLSEECEKMCAECKQWQTMNQQQQLELSLIEKSFKVKIELLEKDKKELSEMLTIDKDTFQYFLDTIKRLKGELSSTQADLLLSFNKMNDHSLNEISLKGKLDALALEKKDLQMNLTTKSELAENLESKNEELRKALCNLQKKIFEQTTSVGEMQNAASTAIVVLQELLLGVLENHEPSFIGSASHKDYVEDVRKNIICILREIDPNEEVTNEFLITLTNKLVGELNKIINKMLTKTLECNALLIAREEELKRDIHQLEISLSEEQKAHGALQEKITILENVETSLTDKMPTLYKESIEDLEDNLSSAESAYTVLKFKRKTSTTNRNQQSDVVTIEKKELAELATEVINKNLQLEKNIQEMKIGFLNKEKELLSIKKEKTSVECKHQELSETLAAEIRKSQCLELKLENWKMFVMSLDESLLHLFSKQKDLETNFVLSVENYKNIIKELETKLSVTEVECTTLKSEKEDSFLHEIELRQQLDTMINEKNNAIDEVAKVTGKYVQLKQEHENIIEKLETKLSIVEEECNTLKSEREEASLHEIDLRQQLDTLINEKKNATDEVAKVTSKYVQLQEERALESKLAVAEVEFTNLKSEKEEFSLHEIELKQQIDTLLNEKNNATDEVAEISSKYVQLKHEHENIIKELEIKLAMTEVECNTLKSERKESSLREIELKQQFDSLTNEKKNTIDEVEKVTRKYVLLEQEHECKIQDYESRLLIVQTELQNQLQDLATKEESLKNSLTLLEKEKIEMTDKLKVEICKSEELELLVQDLTKSCASFEKELSVKSLKLEEAERQKLTLANESQVLSHSRNGNGNMQCGGEFGFEIISSKSQLWEDIQTESLAQVSSLNFNFDDTNMLIPTYQGIESAKALCKFTLHSLEEINALEQDLITQLETFKFLCYYKLIGRKDLTCIWKKFLSLSKPLQQIQFLKKFMFCVQDILKSSVATRELNNSNLIILAKFLPKRLQLAIQNLYYMCGDTLSKVLCVVSQNFPLCKSAMEQCPVFSSSVHKNHLPVITSTKYILYLHNISRTYIYSISRSSHQDLLWKNRLDIIHQELNMKKALSILNLQNLPHFMNYAVALTEYILESSSIVSYIQPSLLNISTSLHPVLRLLEQYIFDSLNLESDKSMNEINYWKKNCDILGVPECDFVKIISLFECKHKNDNNPSVVTENLSLEIRNLETECSALKADKEALKNALLAEKQKQQSLNATIEEIEHDLGETFQQKQNFKNMVLKTSEVLTQLKTSMGEAKTFLSINFAAEFSDKSCFCEMCIEEEEIDENSSHEKLTLCSLFESIKKLIHIGCQLETEILEFNQADFNGMYKKLQDRNSELEMLLANSQVISKDTHDEIGNLQYELSKEKKNCENIYHAADQKDILILELESKNFDLSNTVKEYKEKLNLSEEKILKLSADIESLSILSAKEDEINSLKKTIEEKALAYENALLKCKEYESKMQLNMDVSSSEEQNAVALSSTEKEIGTLKKTLEEKAVLYADIQLKCKEYEGKIQLLNSVISKLDDQNAVVLSAKENDNKTLKRAMEEKESLYESSQLMCKEYESKIQLLNSAISKLEDQKTVAVLSKEDEIGILRKSLEEEASKYENIQLKCKEYEGKIQLLNSSISKLEEEKALDKHLNALQSTRSLANELADGKSPKEAIPKLQSKVELLKKSNDSLSFTIETMKKESIVAYVEKQNIEESEKLTEQNIQLKEEVLRATQKYICEKQAKEELLSKLKESEKLKVDSDSVISQLMSTNKRLNTDINILKGVLREHEKAILNKNSSLKIKSQTIDQLNIKISEIEQEKLDFESYLKNMENPLKIQLEDMTKQYSILAAEIKRLQLVEVEKLMSEENIHEVEAQRDALIEESNLLRKELEDKNEQLKHHEVSSQELKLKNKKASEALNLEIALRTSLEEELAANQNSIVNLNAQLHKLKVSEDKFKLIKSEQNKVNFALKQQVEVLEKEIKEISIALKQAKEKLCHQQQLGTESEELIEKLKVSKNETCALASNLHKSKSALNNAIQFILNLLEIIITQIGSYSDYPDFEKLKSSLASLLKYWKQGSESSVKSEKFINEVFHNLGTFYTVQVNNHKEEIVMRNHIISIIDCINDMGLYCESNVQNPQNCNFADVTNMSMFETTLTRNFSDIVKTSHSPGSFLLELQQTKKLLKECFDSLKNTISKQAEEIEGLKMKLNELASKSISFATETSEKNKNTYKGKYHLTKVQFQRLEKDYNELVGTCKEMEELIKTLEKDKNTLEEEKKILGKEKQDLEEEANELAEHVNRIETKYNSSNELLDALTEITNLRQKLRQLENEKNAAKQMLENNQPKDEKKVIRSNEGVSYALGTTDSKENVRRIDKFMS